MDNDERHIGSERAQQEYKADQGHDDIIVAFPEFQSKSSQFFRKNTNFRKQRPEMWNWIPWVVKDRKPSKYMDQGNLKVSAHISISIMSTYPRDLRGLDSRKTTITGWDRLVGGRPSESHWVALQGFGNRGMEEEPSILVWTQLQGDLASQIIRTARRKLYVVHVMRNHPLLGFFIYASGVWTRDKLEKQLD